MTLAEPRPVSGFPAAPPAQTIAFNVNGTGVELSALGGETLLDLLRNKLHLTGTKLGCNAGECGACTVLFNGRALCSCLIPATRADGADIVTIEGIGTPEAPSRVQRALIEHGAFQCGFCTPGVVMSITALLQSNPRPSEEDARIALQGNVCRCSGYIHLIAAIRSLLESAPR